MPVVRVEASEDRGRKPRDVSQREEEAMVNVLFRSKDGRLLSLEGLPPGGEGTSSAPGAGDGNDGLMTGDEEEADLLPSDWAL